MAAKLYGLELSHPSHAARGMLELKGIEHEVVDLIPGMQPVQLRFAGFRGPTVPALRIDGRKVQTSLAISRALDEIKPEPPLFPSDPERRRAVEEAERWGDEVLQPVPRRMLRWGVWRNRELRLWLARGALPAPLARPVAATGGPQAKLFAVRLAGATDERVRRDVEELPALLDRVDELIAEGVIGGEQPNAADFQILSTIASLRGFDDLRAVVEGRPAAEHAERLFPPYPASVPPFLPADWLAALRR